MSETKYRAYPCKFGWEGSFYYLQIFKDGQWIDAYKTVEGLDLVTFVPGGEENLKNSFEPDELTFIRLGVFKLNS